MKKKVVIIGSGFSSLSASCYLAKNGFEVSVFEKNNTFGGRASQFKKDGFTFDIGPSWYWMPDVFEKFFSDFNKKVSDYYFLKKLDPAYEVYFSDGKSIKIGDTLEKIYSAFENEEKGSSVKLKKFIKNAEENYNIAVKDLVYNMPGISPLELVTLETIKKIGYFMSTIKKEVNREFTNPKLSQILQFPSSFPRSKTKCHSSLL
jgi:phytoene desaturase